MREALRANEEREQNKLQVPTGSMNPLSGALVALPFFTRSQLKPLRLIARIDHRAPSSAHPPPLMGRNASALGIVPIGL
jgi:hypothetical protein